MLLLIAVGDGWLHGSALEEAEEAVDSGCWSRSSLLDLDAMGRSCGLLGIDGWMDRRDWWWPKTRKGREGWLGRWIGEDPEDDGEWVAAVMGWMGQGRGFLGFSKMNLRVDEYIHHGLG